MNKYWWIKLPEVEAKILEVNQGKLITILEKLWASIWQKKLLTAIWLEWKIQDEVTISIHKYNEINTVNIWSETFFVEDFTELTIFLEKLWFIKSSKNWKLTTFKWKNIDWKFRVRWDWETVAVEIKEIITWWKAKVANETWFESKDNSEAIINWFKSIWFQQLSTSIKNRIACLLELEWWAKAEIVFDTYLDLDWMEIPTLVEIETKEIRDDFVPLEWIKIDEQLKEEAYKVILQVAELLWFTEDDLVTLDALWLVKHYKEKWEVMQTWEALPKWDEWKKLNEPYWIWAPSPELWELVNTPYDL